MKSSLASHIYHAYASNQSQHLHHLDAYSIRPFPDASFSDYFGQFQHRQSFWATYFKNQSYRVFTLKQTYASSLLSWETNFKVLLVAFKTLLLSFKTLFIFDICYHLKLSSIVLHYDLSLNPISNYLFDIILTNFTLLLYFGLKLTYTNTLLLYWIGVRRFHEIT